MASKTKAESAVPPVVSFGAEQLASVYSKIDVLLDDERNGAAWAVAAELRGDPAAWQKAIYYVRDRLSKDVQNEQKESAATEPSAALHE